MLKNITKRCVLTFVIIVGFLWNVSAQSYQPTTYFTIEELPDLIQCLPAPPDSTSEAFSYDILRYMWGKLQRYDTERADMAKRHRRDTIRRKHRIRMLSDKPRLSKTDGKSTKRVQEISKEKITSLKLFTIFAKKMDLNI